MHDGDKDDDEDDDGGLEMIMITAIKIADKIQIFFRFGSHPFLAMEFPLMLFLQSKTYQIHNFPNQQLCTLKHLLATVTESKQRVKEKSTLCVSNIPTRIPQSPTVKCEIMFRFFVYLTFTRGVRVP